jgi:predicted short-subunit dehydrogenase-like oxidoreductase (DUF2520 family)
MPCAVVSGYASRSAASANYAAELTHTKAYADQTELAAASDVLLLTVPDGEIEAACVKLRRACMIKNIPLTGKVVLHVSGSRASEELKEAEEAGAHIGSLHPACAIFDRETAWKNLRGTPLIYEGSLMALQAISPLLDLLGNPIGNIPTEKKPLYHAACVFLSNLVCGLAQDGIDLLRQCGIEQSQADLFLRSLFAGNAANIAKLGPKEALTGPVERGDMETVEKHRAALGALKDPMYAETYESLTQALIELAEKKHHK